jgi:hypothetical protein
MAQEPSKGYLFHLVRKILRSARCVRFGGVEENRWPLIEVKVLSLSNVSLS